MVAAALLGPGIASPPQSVTRPTPRIAAGGSVRGGIGSTSSTPASPAASTGSALGGQTAFAGSAAPGASTVPSRSTVPGAPVVAGHASAGTVAQYRLAAPWVGGTSRFANVWVYTPHGYTASGARYPVLYEVPWGGDGWNAGIGVFRLLDTLIAAGDMPPSIVVFVNQAQGPYRPSECADSWDGREWFDTYVAATVVPWVDGRFRTIAVPLARTLIGFSQGGYCAPTLLLHHPNEFGNAVSFSGYYEAGIYSSETRTAWLPFGRDPALIARDSPLTLANHLPSAERAKLFLVLVGVPSEPFYGPQLTAFARVLAAAGYPHEVIDAPVGHSWRQVRLTFETAIAAVWSHQRAAGLVTPPPA